jgi:hypothetical protein
MALLHGTGPVDGTGAGGGTGADRRGVSSGSSSSEVVTGAPGGVGVGSAGGSAAGEPDAGPPAPGCVGGVAAGAGGGEACWGADTAARLAARVVVPSEAGVSEGIIATTDHASSPSTVMVDAIASQRRLQ